MEIKWAAGNCYTSHDGGTWRMTDDIREFTDTYEKYPIILINEKTSVLQRCALNGESIMYAAYNIVATPEQSQSTGLT